MTHRPIIFSAPMVRALLDGTKTQTRRVLSCARTISRSSEHSGYLLRGEAMREALVEARNFRCIEGEIWSWYAKAPDWQDLDDHVNVLARLPYAIGDRLWVREIWGINHYKYCRPLPIPKSRPSDLEDHELVYFATEDDCEVRNEMPATPSIHMPRWASRITLTVTDVRVERLQDISEADAIAEGLEPEDGGWRSYEIIHSGARKGKRHPHAIVPNRSPVTSYAELWDSINGPDAWDANPWVVAVSFAVVLGNIDQVEQREAA
jgi:hypothetical protein